MHIVKGVLQDKENLTETLRSLVANEEILVVDVSRKDSVWSTTSKLKKEGYCFKTITVDEEIHIQKKQTNTNK
ncbi:hypothetical protein GCM10027037_03380 [Mucilaginibacter koreensis]